MEKNKLYQEIIKKYEYKLEHVEFVSKKMHDLGFQFTVKDYQLKEIFKEIINDLNKLL